jgi:cephalosporin hydroxylase
MSEDNDNGYASPIDKERGYYTRPIDNKKLRDFHNMYFFDWDKTWKNTYWLGKHVYKFPTDLWIAQEIIASVKPDILIETGTAEGGSALFYASIMDILNYGRVISIDTRQDFTPTFTHPRIDFVVGASTNPDIVSRIKSQIKSEDVIVVNLDSEHTFHNVTNELNIWGPLVSIGSYLICEDTSYTPAAEALAAWLPSHPEFEVDYSKECHYLTEHHGGYLKRCR